MYNPPQHLWPPLHTLGLWSVKIQKPEQCSENALRINKAVELLLKVKKEGNYIIMAVCVYKVVS